MADRTSLMGEHGEPIHTYRVGANDPSSLCTAQSATTTAVDDIAAILTKIAAPVGTDTIHARR